GSFGVKVRVKLPDGSTTECKTRWPLYPSDVGYLFEGSVVPVRYDPSDHSKVALDIPALEARHKQATAAQQAQLDAQVAHLGEPDAQATGGPAPEVLAGLGGGGDLNAQLLQRAAQNPEPAPAKLAALNQQGILTADQFSAAKAKILGES